MVKCDVIQDLLPLYCDGVASEGSRKLVDEHIVNCLECSEILSKMRNGNEPPALLKANQAESGAFKKIKRKLFRKNVIVALGSVAAFIALVVGFFNLVLLPQTPIPYEDGLLVAQVNTAKFTGDENGILTITLDPNSTGDNYEKMKVLDILSARKTANRSTTSYYFKENGENVRLMFINFTENLLSKWEKGGETDYSTRIIEPHDIVVLSENGEDVDRQVSDRIEVYYINQKISEINVERDYADLRANGTLIWSGKLE
jgi:hypothetical protein